MNFLFYLLVIFLAVISNSFVTIILITLRVGISCCNEISSSNDFNQYEKLSAHKLRKKYFLSLFIDTLIVLIISCIIIFFMKKYCIIYFSVLVIFILLSISKTGKNNSDNLEEFNNSLKANYPYGNSDNKE